MAVYILQFLQFVLLHFVHPSQSVEAVSADSVCLSNIEHDKDRRGYFAGNGRPETVHNYIII